MSPRKSAASDAPEAGGDDARTPPAAPMPGERFEDHLRAVETAVRRLESGELPLEDSIDLYADAMRHLKACHAFLSAAEARLEIVRQGVDGPRAVPTDDSLGT